MSESLDQENKLVIAESTESQEDKVSVVLLLTEALCHSIMKVVFPLFTKYSMAPKCQNGFLLFFEKLTLLFNFLFGKYSRKSEPFFRLSLDLSIA